MRMTIKGVRLAFPAIFVPQAVGDGEPAYGAKLIIPPNHPQVAAIRAAIDEAAKEKWNDKAPSVLKLLQSDKKVAWVESPYLDKNGEPYDGFEGMYHLSTRSAKVKPSAYAAKNVELKTEDGTIYAGCVVDAAVEFYAQDNKWGRRVNCGLRGVRFIAHGDSFGGGSAASADEFGAPIEVEDAPF